MGFLVLAALVVLAMLAASAVAARGFAERTSEGAMAALASWVALLVVPALALGWTDRLTAPALAACSALLSTGVLVAAVAARNPWLHLRAAVRFPLEVGRALLAVLGDLWKVRSLALIGVVSVIGMVVYTAWLAYLAPSSGWDAAWYHDSIVGFAIQNHGFRWVAPIPPNLEYVNGYPKGSEMISLFLAIFWDRRLIDTAPSLMAPLLFLSFYVIARRYDPTRRVALGLGSALILIPAVALELRSTYIDVTYAAMLVTSLALVTRPVLRGRDVALAGICIGLTGTMKGLGVVSAPLLAGVLLLRLIIGRGGWRPLAMWVPAMIVGVAVMAPGYWRNWKERQNPLWPAHVYFDSIGIRFEGLREVIAPIPGDLMLDELLDPPRPNGEQHDTRTNGYGNAPPFLIPPLFVVGLYFALIAVIRGIAARAPPERGADNLFWVVIPALALLPFSPALWWGRLNIAQVAAAFAVVTWLLARPRLRLLAEGVIGALIVASWITLFWSKPGWEAPLKRAIEMASMSPELRAAQKMTFYLPEEHVALARDRELGPGDVMALPRDYGFSGVYWNEQYSNRVLWANFVGGRDNYLRRLDELGAEWAVGMVGGVEERALTSSPETWERIGMFNDRNVAFRRKLPPRPAVPPPSTRQ